MESARPALPGAEFPKTPLDSQPCLLGVSSGIAIVEKREVCMTFHGKGQSLRFTGMETGTEMSRHGPKQWRGLQASRR